MSIREEITEAYPDETFLFADGFDDAIIGIDSKFLVCYDQDKCIEILSQDMTNEEAGEYFWYNVEGAHMGEKTPRFIKRFNNARGDQWHVDQYNRNRDPKDQIKTIDEMPNIYESPNGGKTVYKRKFGDYSLKEKIESGLEFGEGEGHD